MNAIRFLTTCLLCVMVLLPMTSLAQSGSLDPQRIAARKLSECAKIFKDGRLGQPHPMYHPIVKGIAYYEFEILSPLGDPTGYIIVSATRKDVPVPEYSHTTRSHYRRFLARLGHPRFKMVRYGSVYVAAEDEAGKLLAHIGERPPILMTDVKTYEGPRAFTRRHTTRSKAPALEDYPLEYYRALDYTEFKTLYAFMAEPQAAPQQWSALENGTRATYRYETVDGTKCYWRQIMTETCYTGCGPTAWSNLLGWWEKARGKSNLFAGAPDCCVIDSAVSSCIYSIVEKVGTYCIGDNGATNPWQVYKGYSYASDKGYGYGYNWHWRIPGTGYGAEAQILRDAAAAKRATIIGYYSDWHYGVGIQYKINEADADDIEVQIITGWGCNDTKWVAVNDIMAVVDFWIP